jgi:ribonuclease Z
VMDTGLCDNVFALAEGVDLLVIESTFLAEDAAMAAQVGHLTAGQAAAVARESKVRTLVLTHFSQRYPDATRFRDEARAQFDGDIVVAEDLMRVPVPPRLTSDDDRAPAYRK